MAGSGVVADQGDSFCGANIFTNQLQLDLGNRMLAKFNGIGLLAVIQGLQATRHIVNGEMAMPCAEIIILQRMQDIGNAVAMNKRFDFFYGQLPVIKSGSGFFAGFHPFS